jgi:hypothetical protein
MKSVCTSQSLKHPGLFSLVSGTYFVLYDFIDQFDKDSASFLPREKFIQLINATFKDRPQIEHDAIVFQVRRSSEERRMQMRFQTACLTKTDLHIHSPWRPRRPPSLSLSLGRAIGKLILR